VSSTREALGALQWRGNFDARGIDSTSYVDAAGGPSAFPGGAGIFVRAFVLANASLVVESDSAVVAGVLLARAVFARFNATGLRFTGA
jgi:hypothetical protein